ncbi:hypothetical protein LCGC14_1186920, partial [marine sediment metagenome]
FDKIRRYRSGNFAVKRDDSTPHNVGLHHELLDVEDDIRNVFEHAGQGHEFMVRTCDLHAGYSGAFEA